jgi:hypothetical protein
MRESRRLGGIGCLIYLSLGRWHGEQLACLRDVVGAGAIGEQAVVADAVEAVGAHMDEETGGLLWLFSNSNVRLAQAGAVAAVQRFE